MSKINRSFSNVLFYDENKSLILKRSLVSLENLTFYRLMSYSSNLTRSAYFDFRTIKNTTLYLGTYKNYLATRESITLKYNTTQKTLSVCFSIGLERRHQSITILRLIRINGVCKLTPSLRQSCE
jgi:hypothetical protein